MSAHAGRSDEDAAGRVPIRFDGRGLTVTAGRSLAAALMEAGVYALRRSPVTGAPRGAFCLMGSCQECVVVVDGRRTTACTERVRTGMSVVSGRGPE